MHLYDFCESIILILAKDWRLIEIKIREKYFFGLFSQVYFSAYLLCIGLCLDGTGIAKANDQC